MKNVDVSHIENSKFAILYDQYYEYAKSQYSEEDLLDEFCINSIILQDLISEKKYLNARKKVIKAINDVEICIDMKIVSENNNNTGENK